MLVVVAIPCLDEESLVEEVCRSLGFGPDSQDPGVQAVLVLVDNGSRDGTLPAMGRVAAGSPTGAVRVVREATTGFVPARHRGAVEALRIARDLGVREDDVLLVQADADTAYMPGYLAAMARCSAAAGTGALIEGYSEAGAAAEGFAAYRALEAKVDAAVEEALLDDEFDVVVDDKVAALRLSDYVAWGGHRREWAPDGDELLAETTRLYMRGRLLGGRRCRAEAFAWTSLRRVIQDPGLAFATAGYPRGPRWRAAWLDAYVGPFTLCDFELPLTSAAAVQLVHSRVLHLFGLFKLLPAWMEASLATAVRERPGYLHGSPSAEFGTTSPGAVVAWATSRPWEVASADLADSAIKAERVALAATEAKE